MKITPSSGCVFCDIGCKPIKNSLGTLVHGDKKTNQWVVCPLNSSVTAANTGHTTENGKKRQIHRKYE